MGSSKYGYARRQLFMRAEIARNRENANYKSRNGAGGVDRIENGSDQNFSSHPSDYPLPLRIKRI